MRTSLILLLAAVVSARIIDRLVITVGRETITESELEEDIAVTAFFNREPVRHDETTRRAAAHRLVEQALITADMELAHFPGPQRTQIDTAAKRLKSEFESDQEYRSQLAAYQLSEPIILTHLERELAVLQFIDYRFRPELTASDSDLQEANGQSFDEWKERHPGGTEAEFRASREVSRARRQEERVDAALDRWLSQAGSQARIIYLDHSLEPRP